MNILAQYNLNSGSSYHRVKLWGNACGVKFVEQITEEDVKGVDIVYIHWNSIVPLGELSVWKQKYQFKVIADIDDVWLDYDDIKMQISIAKSKHLCFFADHVICSTPFIKTQIFSHGFKLPHEISVVPNVLPNNGQFKPNPTISNKIRIGIGGSISHIDDFLSLSGVIKQLQKDKWFKKNCQFVLFGITQNPLWKKVIDMFDNDVVVYKAKPVEQYMSLYDNIDIMLLPLLNTMLNNGRSDLKIRECAAKNINMIISKEYLKKGNYPELLVEDWVKNIKKIVTGYSSKITFEDTFDKNVNFRLDIFDKLIMEKSNCKHYDLYSVKYDEKQDVEYIPYLNEINSVENKSYLFEYNVILDIVPKCKEEYTGIFSHKFPHKTGYYKKYVENLVDNLDADIGIFCHQTDNYLDWSENQHPGLLKRLQFLCDQLNLEMKTDVTIYSNFFVMKTSLYKEYCELLKDAITIMENNKDLFFANANYKSGLSSEDLKKYTGLDFYTYHTFVLERLIGIWITNKKLVYEIYE